MLLQSSTAKAQDALVPTTPSAPRITMGRSSKFIGNFAVDSSVPIVSSATLRSRRIIVPSPRTPRAKFGILRDVDSRNPSTPYSSGGSSLETSPFTPGDIWEPKTPHQATMGSAHMFSTPLTPATAHGVAIQQELTFALLSLINSKSPSVAETIEARIPKRVKVEGCGFFKPEKLVWNMTGPLQAIVAENEAITARGGFKIEPSCEFSSDSMRSAGRPTQPKAKAERTKAKATVNDEITHKTQPPVNITAVPFIRIQRQGFEKTLELIAPWDLHTRLNVSPHRCVASLVSDSQRQCSNKAQGSSTDADNIISRLVKHNRTHISSHLVTVIEQLVLTVMCGTHRNVALCQKRIGELEEVILTQSNGGNNKLASLRAWLQAISSPEWTFQDPWLHAHTDRKTRSQTTKTQPTSPSAAATANTDPFTYKPRFTPYQPKKQLNLSVTEALLSEINKPLTATAVKSGFIYMFWDRKNFGMVKIGFTKDPEQRLKEWNSRCNREHFYHGGPNSAWRTEIQHASRVERLMHLELKNLRLKRECEGCGKTHKEWFDVTETKAAEVYGKWQKWIMEEPYAKNHETGNWVIKEEMKETVKQICEQV